MGDLPAEPARSRRDRPGRAGTRRPEDQQLALTGGSVMDANTWALYLAAIAGLSLSPGPHGLLVLTHGAVYGWRKATYTVSGGVFGFVVVIALSLFGIGALLQASLAWLAVMKWVGGAYLIWLGIQVWRAPPVGVASQATQERSR